MRIDRSFSWLGRFPIAVDLADTIRVVGGGDVELLIDEEALSVWVDAERPRFPVVEAARGRLSEVLHLRNSVRGVLIARAAGAGLPDRDLGVINEAAGRCPSFPRVGHEGQTQVVELNDDPFDVFCATVARSAIESIHRASSIDLAVCHAPSCGMLFVPASGRQRWCSPGCGNRARVARHAARAGHRAADAQGR